MRNLELGLLVVDSLGGSTRPYLVRLVNTMLKDGESARDNYVLAYNFAKYSPI